MLKDLILKNRSYRRFNHSAKIETALLESWVGLARLSASGRNAQPLKYVICNSEEITAAIFPNLGWAGYLTNWRGPEENERPVAYIVIIHDKTIGETYFCDDGLAIQNILLGAVNDGFGGCIIGSFNKSKVSGIIKLPHGMEILWIVALGKPSEKVVIEEIKDGDVKYWRDDNEVHHVPKRPLSELILKKL